MKITIPDNWNEVTVLQYQEISELPEDDYRANSIISILTDLDDVDKISVDDRLKIISAMRWIFSPPDENKYNRQVNINGIDFYLQDYTDLKIGERIDLKEYSKNVVKNLHKIFAILYRPEKEIKNASELFLNAKIGEVYGSMVFFSIIAKKSLKNLQLFMMEEIQSQITKQKKKK